MASALLALAKPVYQGIQAEKKFIHDNPGIAGDRFSMKRVKSIPYGFGAFAKGFIGGGGTDKLAGMVAKKRAGGVVGPMLRVEESRVRGAPGPFHGRRDAGSIVAGMSHGSPQVLGYIPHVGHRRELHRRQHDASVAVVG